MVNKIRGSCLGWFGHINRQPVDEPVKTIEALDLTYVKNGRGRPNKMIIEKSYLKLLNKFFKKYDKIQFRC